MSRRSDLSAEDRRLWARVSGSVTPARPAKAPLAVLSAPPPPPAATGGRPNPAAKPAAAGVSATPGYTPPQSARTRGPAQELEPRRQRRLGRERDPIEARLDLHGHGRFQAQDALVAFLTRAQARGLRSVLVITGQGRRGGVGVIRASVHEWLQAPALRGVVSGHAPAARRHGGDGALYVTLRRG